MPKRDSENDYFAWTIDKFLGKVKVNIFRVNNLKIAKIDLRCLVWTSIY